MGVCEKPDSSEHEGDPDICRDWTQTDRHALAPKEHESNLERLIR